MYVLRSTTAKEHDLVVAKTASCFILGLSALFCALLPVIIIRKYSSKTSEGLGSRLDSFLGLLLRIGGGILLATTFLHLLPEVREGFEDLVKDGYMPNNWPIQIPELVMCMGFFLMYGVEEGAHACLFKGHQHEENEQGGHSHVVSSTPLRGILIIIALSVHQVFEGLAVGLESDVDKVWVLLAAIAAHKLVIAVCVGAEMASSRSSWLTQGICIGVFAIASPIGIGTGIALSSGHGSEVTMNCVSVILQGLATGTLLYVVFFEVLNTAREGHSTKGAYFFATVIGFILMLILLCFFQS